MNEPKKISLAGKKCYVCNCKTCGRLFMRNKESVKRLGIKWKCPECFTVNKIRKSDLM